MKRFNLKIFLLFFLLVDTAAVPVFFTAVHNRYYLDKTAVFPVQVDSLEAGAENYDLWDRLKILKNAALVQTRNRKNYRVSYYTRGDAMAEVTSPMPEDADGQIKNQVIRRAEKQLDRLKKYQTLPEIPFSDLRTASCVKQTYMDMENPAYILSVWELYMEYPHVLVHLYMDMETSALCEVEISSIGKSFTYQKENMSAQGFLEYLNSFSKASGKGHGTDEAQAFYGKGVFTQQYICLYAASSDKNGSRIIEYRFDP